MDTQIAVLATLHVDDLHREAQARRRGGLIARCRRMLLGVLPLSEPCEPCTTC